jgi:hypothetical protein
MDKIFQTKEFRIFFFLAALIASLKCTTVLFETNNSKPLALFAFSFWMIPTTWSLIFYREPSSLHEILVKFFSKIFYLNTGIVFLSFFIMLLCSYKDLFSPMVGYYSTIIFCLLFPVELCTLVTWSKTRREK